MIIDQTIKRTDIEVQMDIFALAKNFDELVQDMYNNLFSQTIIQRKNELYSDYQRTTDGYVLLNTSGSSGVLRVELQKQLFINGINVMLEHKKYIFNPYFTEFINNNILTPQQQNNDLQNGIDNAQQQLLTAQQQIQELLQKVNSTLNDKDNIQQNYDQIIQQINTNYAELQQKYTDAQQKIINLQTEKLRLAKLYASSSILNQRIE
jgi:hypothetical protein